MHMHNCFSDRMDYYCGYGITLYSHGAYQVLVKFSPDDIVLVGNNCNFTITSGNYRMAVRAFDFGVVSDEGYACNRHLTMHLRFNSTSPIYGRYSLEKNTVNSEIFARTLFSRNFAYAKFRENETLAK